jgi:HPr kinase/phosphorylase|tara:strand:- start:320 stop:805 length:486 start_codon:yes stop_codon:yes gene_type:complete
MSNNKNNTNSVSQHGVLISLYNIGILLIGKSGIGKSECAIELLNKGARLISDDIVIIENIRGSLIGKPPDAIKELIEIRGIGIINVREIFGSNAIENESKIDLVVELISFNENHDYERLGYDTTFMNILNIEIPTMQIPVSPGRNLSTLIEIAAKKLIFER